MTTTTTTTTTVASIEEEEEEEFKSNWSEIPCDLLYLMMSKLSKIPHDYIRFRSVCFSWNSIPDNHVRRQYSQLPLLMAPPTSSSFSNQHHHHKEEKKKKKKNKNKKYRTKLRTFYNILDFKVDVRFKGITMPSYRQCRGSSHGWLISVDDDIHKSFPVRLFNPFFLPSSLSLSLSLSGSSSSSCSGNGMEIMLPSLHTFPIGSPKYLFKAESYDYLSKAVLSANPISNPADYKVMAIYSGCFKLAFFKSGNKAWTDVQLPDGSESGYEDVIYYQGKFLAVDYEGTVVVCDDDVAAEGGGMTARILLQPPKVADSYPTRILKADKPIKHIIQSRYIVESSRGTLLQVQRNILYDETTTYSTIGFRVFELVLLVHDHPIITDAQIVSQVDGLPGDYYEWAELKSLCGDTIFLGHSTSISLSGSDHYPGCKPNSIYYVDDSDFYIDDTRYGPHDMGLFNLGDGSFKRYFVLDHNVNISIGPIWPIPIWIQPILPK